LLKYQLGNDAQEVKLDARIHKEYAVARGARIPNSGNAGGIDFRFRPFFAGAEISGGNLRKTLLSGRD